MFCFGSNKNNELSLDLKKIYMKPELNKIF